MINLRFYIFICVISIHNGLSDNNLPPEIADQLITFKEELWQQATTVPDSQELGLKCETGPFFTKVTASYCNGHDGLSSETIEESWKNHSNVTYYVKVNVDYVGLEFFLAMQKSLIRILPTPFEIYFFLPKTIITNPSPNISYAFATGTKSECFEKICWQYQTVLVINTEFNSYWSSKEPTAVFYSLVESFEEPWRNSTILMYRNFDSVETTLLKVSNFIYDRFRTAFTGKILDLIPFYGFQNIFFANDIYLRTLKIITETNKFSEEIEISYSKLYTIKHSFNEPWPIHETEFNFMGQKGIPKNPAFMKYMAAYDKNYIELIKSDFNYGGDSINVLDNYYYEKSKRFNLPTEETTLMLDQKFYLTEMGKSLKIIMPNVQVAGLEYDHLFNFFEEALDLPSYYDKATDKNFCIGEDCENNDCPHGGCFVEERKTIISFPKSCSPTLNITLVDLKESEKELTTAQIGNFFLGNVNLQVHWQDNVLGTFEYWDEVYSLDYLNTSNPSMGIYVWDFSIASAYADDEDIFRITNWFNEDFSRISLDSFAMEGEMSMVILSQNGNINATMNHLDNDYWLMIIDEREYYNITGSPNLTDLDQFCPILIEAVVEVLNHSIDVINQVLNTVNVKCGDQPSWNVLRSTQKHLGATVSEIVDYILLTQKPVNFVLQMVISALLDATTNSFILPHHVISDLNLNFFSISFESALTVLRGIFNFMDEFTN